MKSSLRCAVIGVGYLGRFHAQKYAKIADDASIAGPVIFVGVADADAARAQAVATELATKAYAIDDLVVLAKKGELDAVTIAASTRAHYELTKKFLLAGVHVNVEKPMTATLEEGEEVVRIAREKNLVLQVGHVERFNPALTAAREKLKRPLFIECHRLAPFKPRGVDVDVVLDLMIHDLDVILSLVKSPVKSVSAVGTPVLTALVDIANARVEFESGTVANITASRVSQSATRKFRVFQEKQYLSIDFGSGDVNLTTKTGGDWPEDLSNVTDPTQLPLEFEHWSLEKGDALMIETTSFIKACRGEGAVAVPGSDGLEAMRLASRIQEAIRIALSERSARDTWMKTEPRRQRVLIVAGEASSSLYALRLIEQWRNEGHNYDLFGIGSREMESVGFRRLGKSEEMAVVGLQEVIKHFPLIRRVYNSLLAECDLEKPDFALLLDYPDFNLRLAKDLKKRGIRVIYYISPQVWAWRTSRVNLIRRVVDEMLVVFPFEEPFYKKHNVSAAFVGHPLLDELARRRPKSAVELRAQRERFAIGDDEIILGLMPGSRESELKNHLSSQLEAAELLVRRYPKVRPVLLCAPTIERERLRDLVSQAGAAARVHGTELSSGIQIIKEDPLDMIELSDILLVASGTATLMVGLLAKPMVIMYRMNGLTAWFAKRLVKHTRFFGMVNLILEREVARELFQEEASPEGMATELEKLLDPAAREQKSRELLELRSRLGSQGATSRVAERLKAFFS